MTDKEIYEKIGQIIYNETPQPDGINHCVVYIPSGCASVTRTHWHGSGLSPESSYTLSTEATGEINDQFIALKKYFEENSMGEWNVAHFSVTLPSGAFDIYLEQNEELESRNIYFYKYIKQKFANN